MGSRVISERRICKMQQAAASGRLRSCDCSEGGLAPFENNSTLRRNGPEIGTHKRACGDRKSERDKAGEALVARQYPLRDIGNRYRLSIMILGSSQRSAYSDRSIASERAALGVIADVLVVKERNLYSDHIYQRRA
jgi:hypothetical protein